jgi:PAS domain S-box-containing protein
VVDIRRVHGGSGSDEGLLERSRILSGTAPAARTESPLWSAEQVQGHGVFMLSRTGRVLSWSPGAEAVHGHGADEVIGQSFEIFFTAEAVAGGEPGRQLDRALRLGHLHQEGWRVRQDGSRFWANQVLTPLHDRLGRLRGFGAVTQVLTDRMRVQDLMAVLDAATDAVLGVDDGGRVMFTNEAAARMFGYPKDELVGRMVEDLVPARFRHRHQAHRSGYAHDPRPRPMGGDLELRAVRSDGSEFPAEVSLSSVSTPRGPVVTALIRDLTDRRRADAARRLDQERLRALFEHSPVGQIEARMDAVTARANGTLEAMLGHAPGELRGRNWLELVHPQDRSRLRIELEAVIAGATPAYSGQLRLVHRTGGTVPALLLANVLRDRSGQPYRMMVVAIDARTGPRTSPP